MGKIMKNANCVKFWNVKIVAPYKIFALRRKKVFYSVLTFDDRFETELQNKAKGQNKDSKILTKPFHDKNN